MTGQGRRDDPQPLPRCRPRSGDQCRRPHGDFIEANGEILREVDTNNFPVRAKGLAAEIISKSPDLVGLQEVALWRTGPPVRRGTSRSARRVITPPRRSSTTTSQLLMDQLNKGKKRYRVVKVQDEFDFEAPANYDNDRHRIGRSREINGRLTMRDVDPRQGRCRRQDLATPRRPTSTTTYNAGDQWPARSRSTAAGPASTSRSATARRSGSSTPTSRRSVTTEQGTDETTRGQCEPGAGRARGQGAPSRRAERLPVVLRRPQLRRRHRSSRARTDDPSAYNALCNSLQGAGWSDVRTAGSHRAAAESDILTDDNGSVVGLRPPHRPHHDQPAGRR